MSLGLKRRRESSEPTDNEFDLDSDPESDPESRMATHRRGRNASNSATSNTPNRRISKRVRLNGSQEEVFKTPTTEGGRTRRGKLVNYTERDDDEDDESQDESENESVDDNGEPSKHEDEDDQEEDGEDEDELTRAEPAQSRRMVKLSLPPPILERFNRGDPLVSPVVTGDKRPFDPTARTTQVDRTVDAAVSQDDAALVAEASSNEEADNKSGSNDDDDDDDDDEDAPPVPVRRSRRGAVPTPITLGSDAAEDQDDEQDKSDDSSTNRPRRSKRKQTAPPPPPPPQKSSRKRRMNDSDSDAEIGSDDDEEDEDDEPVEDQIDSESSEQSYRNRQRPVRNYSARNTRNSRNVRSSTRRRVNEDYESDSSPEIINPTRRSDRASRAQANMRRNEEDLQRMHRQRVKDKPDYRIFRPELNNVFEDLQSPRNDTSRGGGAGFRNFLSGIGGRVGGRPGADNRAVGHDSDSSDDGVALGTGGQPKGMPMAGGGVGGAAPTSASLGQVKDRQALADADPLGVDTNVTFDGVGGLDDHINQLKEMVLLPLLYPEVFQQFKITPPRGVLFHGPPGTGKTLLARALAASVSSQGKKVTFYMRKGADALSKWVGEAERQLRLLFEDARKNQPSIIFFDEIDGLAPVRSSKQEQIHASIVATILALMDGMDGRGQVIVIGATNRPDNVDPALRRPGRFDREFYFPLPNITGRRAILDIHTKGWEPPLAPEFKDQLADLTKGYGGADLRALCTEAALNAVQGTFPQIYQSNTKLRIDPTQIRVQARDFMTSVAKIVPSSARTTGSNSAPLSEDLKPLLQQKLVDLSVKVERFLAPRKQTTALEEAKFVRDESTKGFELELMDRRLHGSRIFRPRILIRGPEGMGHVILAAALFNKFETIYVQNFGLASVMADSSRPPEAAIVQLFSEARQRQPSVIYIPDADVWLETLPTSAVRTFLSLLKSLPPSEGVMVLGTMEHDEDGSSVVSRELLKIFGSGPLAEVHLSAPTMDERRAFFKPLIEYIGMAPDKFPDQEHRKKRKLIVLEPVAEEGETNGAGGAGALNGLRNLSEEERKTWEKQKRVALSHLRLVLQPVMTNIRNKFKKLRTPVISDASIKYLFEAPPPPPALPLLMTDIARPNSGLRPQVLSIQINNGSSSNQNPTGPDRPFELATDSAGVPGLKEVSTGKFYYNIDTVMIERRLGSGEYLRPADFVADVERLVADAHQFGDPERLTKAREMLAHVDVDIHYVEGQNGNLLNEWEEIYQRERQEQKAREVEKSAKGKETVLAPVDVTPMNDSRDTDVIMIDESVSYTPTHTVNVAGPPHSYYPGNRPAILGSNAGELTPNFASAGPSALASHSSLPDTQESAFDSQTRGGTSLSAMSVSLESTAGRVDLNVQLHQRQMDPRIPPRLDSEAGLPTVASFMRSPAVAYPGAYQHNVSSPQPVGYGQSPYQPHHQQQQPQPYTPFSSSNGHSGLAPSTAGIAGFNPAFVIGSSPSVINNHMPALHGALSAGHSALPTPVRMENPLMGHPDIQLHSSIGPVFASGQPMAGKPYYPTHTGSVPSQMNAQLNHTPHFQTDGPSTARSGSNPPLALEQAIPTRSGSGPNTRSVSKSKSPAATASVIAEAAPVDSSETAIRKVVVVVPEPEPEPEPESEEDEEPPHAPYNLDEDKLALFHTALAEGTAGQTVEELQCTNARLIRAVWATRTEWDRDKVLEDVDHVWRVMDTEEDLYQY